MFNDLDSINKQLKGIAYSSSIAVSRGRVRKFLEAYPEEALFIFSCMLRFDGYMPPQPKVSYTAEIPESWETVFGTLLYHINKEDPNSFNRFYATLPYNYQLLVYFTFSKHTVISVTEKFLYLTLPNVYLEEELISMVELPEFVGEAFSIQNIKRGNQTSVQYPIDVYRGNKTFNISNLKYFVNFGIKSSSNLPTKKTKDDVIALLGKGRYGALITAHKVQGYKYKQQVNCVLYGVPEDIINVYQGKPFNRENVHIHKDVKYVATIENDEQLLEFFKANKMSVRLLFFGTNGLYNIKLKTEFVNAKCIDYITDAHYNPVGVVCRYGGIDYNVYFNVGRTTLIDSIQGRYVRLQVHKFNDIVANISFNSEVKMWSGYAPNCKICGTTSSQHHSSGVCHRCFYQLRGKLDVGAIRDYEVTTKPFELQVRNYSVVGDGTKVSFKLLEGQGVLPLW